MEAPITPEEIQLLYKCLDREFVPIEESDKAELVLVRLCMKFGYDVATTLQVHEKQAALLRGIVEGTRTRE